MAEFVAFHNTTQGKVTRTARPGNKTGNGVPHLEQMTDILHH